MTDAEILRAADKIIRRALATTRDERERAVFRDTLTGLLWVRADITIAEYHSSQSMITADMLTSL